MSLKVNELQALLDAVREGTTKPGEAFTRIAAALREQPYEDLGFAKIDHHRTIRQGFPEVVLGLGKTPDQIAKIATKIVAHGHPLLVTRADEAAWNTVRTAVPAISISVTRSCTNTTPSDCALRRNPCKRPFGSHHPSRGE